ncbi:MAG TPA: LamG-like jellyroll fold domain-containing protein, partial [Anaerolineales bacterium]|nr:LamG-like jellyroll fold domain-containing protein [Anaerolineales bacterium]
MKTKRMKLSVLIRAITIFALVVSIFSSFPVSTVFAEAGYALEFDGVSEYVKLGDTGNLMGGDIWASSKTVSLWVRPDAPTSPATRPEGGVFLVGNDRPRFFGITRATWEGADRLWVWNYDSNGTDMIGIDFVPGEWLQIALVHSGGVLSAYKNGVLVGSVA